MSANTTPISPARFAAALSSLELSNLHAKAAELYNSLSHLRSSNAQLAPFADPASPEYDVICEESIRENQVVMERMRERLGLLKREVEDRGALWVWDRLEDEWEEGEAAKAVEPVIVNGHARASESVVNGGAAGAGAGQSRDPADVDGNHTQQRSLQAQSGRLTDEELARRVMERMDEDDGEGGGGMHL